MQFSLQRFFLIIEGYLGLKVFAFEHGHEICVAQHFGMPLFRAVALFADAVHLLAAFLADRYYHQAAGLQHFHQSFGEGRGTTGDQYAVVLEVFHFGQPVEAVAQEAAGSVV